MNYSIPVIFEDENLLVLDKPSGLVVHPFDHSDEYTLLDFLKQNYPSVLSITHMMALQDGRAINLGGLVHKLDRDTSGVLILAKNEQTYSSLRELFSSHKVQKTYIAVVQGLVDVTSFTIDVPLGRNKKEYKQSTIPTNPRGTFREAVTHVLVLDRGESTSLVELSPKTGRTHQLRAHMASIGHPIVGDIAYGSTVTSERIMLHAEKITFKLHEKEYSFESKKPLTFVAK
jgi:23S rRNA pseudouridine1911/1915/1917 synthase